MDRKIRKGLIVYAALAVLIIASVCISSILNPSIDPEDYTSYICYDYHLSCLKTKGKKGRAKVTYQNEETDGEDTRLVLFQRIKGESDEEFVYAVVPPLLYGYSDKVIMQNPNNYVDVWKEWTINRIELYYGNFIDQDSTAPIQIEVIDSTSNVECLKEFISFVTEIGSEKMEISDGYKREPLVEEAPSKFYGVRVFFNESENIVWDSQVESYYSSERQDRIIYIDRGKKPSHVSLKNESYASIQKYEKLFEWISDAINTH